jgi:hypothetical protein
VRWIMKKVGPAAKTVTTVEELTEVEADGDVTLVGYFGDITGTSVALTAFTEACRSLDISCAQTSVAAVAKAAGASKDSVAVVTKFKVALYLLYAESLFWGSLVSNRLL